MVILISHPDSLGYKGTEEQAESKNATPYPRVGPRVNNSGSLQA